MKSIACSIFIFIFFCFSGNLFSQHTYSGLEKVYGPDPLLFNGKKYDFFPPSGTSGHQFLYSNNAVIGGATIKGVKFEQIKLKYDIYNQEVLLSYADDEGSGTLIQLSKAWLESFNLEERYFETHVFEDGSRFYQVLGNGSVKIFYFWKKYFELDKAFGSKNFSFSSEIKISYVLMQGKLIPFRSKRGFLAIFAPQQKPEIKAYMRNARFKLKNADDESMADLINFISNL